MHTPQPRDLTLIVAATDSMGIGLNGGLPWNGLKKEMAYFARVTKRADPHVRNTVIMGRKTWDSIPPKFRPLKGRTNVVISRTVATPNTEEEGKVVVDSLEKALQHLQKRGDQGRAFIIGGSQIYQASLELRETRRILLTRILGHVECDTHFPVMLPKIGKSTEWERKPRKELEEWIGEQVEGDEEGVVEESGMKYVFEMWERV